MDRGIGSLMGESGRTMPDMDRRIADLGARQGMAPAEQRMMLLQKTAGDMSKKISDRDAQLFAMGEISFEEAMSRAKPNMDMVRAERNEMQQQQLGFAAGGEVFPDLTGDGQVTQADILKGRGVFAEGDEVSRETIEMEAQNAGIPANEVEQALAEINKVEPEMQQLQKMVESVMEMLEAGASEEEIITSLQAMGLDEDDIEAVFEAVIEGLEVEESMQQDPIQSELSQMM
tara:strand:+ start:35 stop:727 length:693 start_codon:yes stop_codon:yes gene_type:complete